MVVLGSGSGAQGQKRNGPFRGTESSESFIFPLITLILTVYDLQNTRALTSHDFVFGERPAEPPSKVP